MHIHTAFPRAQRALLFPLMFLLLMVWFPAQTEPSAQESDPEEIKGGKRFFMQHCARCHGVKGEGGTGPRLAMPVLDRAKNDPALFNIIKGGIPGTGMPGNWMLSNSETRQVASYVRFLGSNNPVAHKGNVENGKSIYQKGDCTKCHIDRGTGGSLGPELTAVGKRRGPEYLRNAIRYPGTDLPLDSGGFKLHLFIRVITSSGNEVRGMRVNEDTFSIQIRDEENRLHSYRKHSLKELHREPRQSFMPSFDETLSATEINDLVAYLLELRGEE